MSQPRRPRRPEIRHYRCRGRQPRRWHLVGANGEIQCGGESHGSASAAHRAVRQTIRNMLRTPVGRRILLDEIAVLHAQWTASLRRKY